MSTREQELVAVCDNFGIPVEGVAPDDSYMITMDRASELPTRDELEWLAGYRSFKEQLEYAPRQIEDMYRLARRGACYPVMPPQVCGLWTYRFVKYGDDDWAYTSHGWTLTGAFPRPPQLRKGLAAAGEPFAGPYSIRELLDAVAGHVDPETGQPVPSRDWVDWLSSNWPPR